MYQVTAKSPDLQPMANLLAKAMDAEFGEHTEIGKALSDAARKLYEQEWFGVPPTEEEIAAAFAPIIEAAKAKYGERNA